MNGIQDGIVGLTVGEGKHSRSANNDNARQKGTHALREKWASRQVRRGRAAFLLTVSRNVLEGRRNLSCIPSQVEFGLAEIGGIIMKYLMEGSRRDLAHNSLRFILP